MREKLIDLMIEAKRTDPETGSFTEYLADFLIANGITFETDNNVSINGDRIRAMTDEELAEVIMCPWGPEPVLCCTKGTCLDCCGEWLKQPAEESDGG